MDTNVTAREAKVPLEPINSSHHALVSWKSVFAGLLVALITHALLTSLGAAIGGLTASNAIQNGRDANGLVVGVGLWTIVTVLVSLALGAYFAARISTFITARVGAAQGLIIASLFFALMIFGVGSALGVMGAGLGNAVSAVSNGAGDLISNTSVQNTLENALGDVNLKSETSAVVQGLAVRLLRGDTEGARVYFARQTGLPPEEVDARMAALREQFDQTVKTVGINAAKAVSAAGWSAFIAMILGLAASVFGGATGSRTNLRLPLTATENNLGMVTVSQT